MSYVLGTGCDVRKEMVWKAQYRGYRGKLTRGRAKHGQSPGVELEIQVRETRVKIDLWRNKDYIYEVVPPIGGYR